MMQNGNKIEPNGSFKSLPGGEIKLQPLTFFPSFL